MFRAEYSNKFSAAHRTIARLNSLLTKRRVSVNSDGPRLIFLCGANRKDGSISARRQAIIEFARVHAPSSAVIIAEDVFASLFQRSHGRNLLDLEESLSVVADRIVIVLEGEGAFCELGAFAHETLREKLLVINDSEFEKSGSFINLGPIKAVTDSAGSNAVMWYPMQPDGIENVDALGKVYPKLLDSLRDSGRRTRKHIDKSALDPINKMDKLRLFFIHDLIFLAGPLTYRSLVDLVVLIFGDRDYTNIRDALALLTAISFVKYEEAKAHISSLRDSAFLDYSGEEQDLQINFTMIRLRSSLRGSG